MHTELTKSQRYSNQLRSISAMKFLLISLTALVSSSVVSGEAWATSIVECSKSKVATNLSLQVCAITSFSTPDPAMTNTGEEIFLEGYHSDYQIVTGLKYTKRVERGVYERLLGSVALDDDEVCKVTVRNKSK
jgi:hypothetical protein